MVEKLTRLMKHEGINSSRLAEILGIQPSGISHIMNGRNKPSFDFITKLLAKFPHINPDWLLLDKGPMYRDEIKAAKNTLAGSGMTSVNHGADGKATTAGNPGGTDSGMTFGAVGNDATSRSHGTSGNVGSSETADPWNRQSSSVAARGGMASGGNADAARNFGTANSAGMTAGNFDGAASSGHANPAGNFSPDNDDIIPSTPLEHLPKQSWMDFTAQQSGAMRPGDIADSGGANVATAAAANQGTSAMSAPRAFPGPVPGAFPGSFPGPDTSSVPGATTGSVPGSAPAIVQGRTAAMAASGTAPRTTSGTAATVSRSINPGPTSAATDPEFANRANFGSTDPAAGREFANPAAIHTAFGHANPADFGSAAFGNAAGNTSMATNAFNAINRTAVIEKIVVFYTNKTFAEYSPE